MSAADGGNGSGEEEDCVEEVQGVPDWPSGVQGIAYAWWALSIGALKMYQNALKCLFETLKMQQNAVKCLFGGLKMHQIAPKMPFGAL